MGWLYVTEIVFMAIGVLIVVSKSEKWEFLGISMLVLSGMIIGITTFSEPDSPAALDVYRGKTRLESTETVRDSVVVKIDSVVVWKDNLREE